MGATSGAGTAYPSAAPEFIYVFSGIRDTQSLVLFVCFVDCCFSLCPFSLGHCVVCSSSIYGFWLPLWCLQTLLGTVYFFGILIFQWLLWISFVLFVCLFLSFLWYSSDYYRSYLIYCNDYCCPQLIFLRLVWVLPV
jgi:hypothetical protein